VERERVGSNISENTEEISWVLEPRNSVRKKYSQEALSIRVWLKFRKRASGSCG
jgi:hypothetical protein